MILASIAHQLTPAGEEDEVVGAVPLLDHVESFIDLAAQRLAVKISAEEDRLDCLAEFGKCLVGVPAASVQNFTVAYCTQR